MRSIILAKKSRRIFAGLIDLLFLAVTTAGLFFGVAFPLSFDGDAYRANEQQVIDIHQESGLFLTNRETGANVQKSKYSGYFTSVEKFSDVDLKLEDKKFLHQNLSKDLYEFYATHYTDFGGTVNLTKETYEKEVLKINTKDSNIASINYETFALTLIDNEKLPLTVNYFLNEYNKACVKVMKCDRVQNLKGINEDLMFSSIIWVLPIIVGMGLIFQFIIPICNAENKTIGKYCFGLAVVDKHGYKLKKWKLIPRFLAYIGIEIILGIITFGGTFLITYTCFLFSKNRRSIHDFVAGTAVIDAKSSIIFENATEEKYFMEQGDKHE